MATMEVEEFNPDNIQSIDVEERIAQEDLEKTQKIAADMKDIKEMSQDLNTNVSKDDEGLAKVNDNLGKVKDHMDEGCDSLRAGVKAKNARNQTIMYTVICVLVLLIIVAGVLYFLLK